MHCRQTSKPNPIKHFLPLVRGEETGLCGFWISQPRPLLPETMPTMWFNACPTHQQYIILTVSDASELEQTLVTCTRRCSISTTFLSLADRSDSRYWALSASRVSARDCCNSRRRASPSLACHSVTLATPAFPSCTGWGGGNKKGDTGNRTQWPPLTIDDECNQHVLSDSPMIISTS